MPNACFVGCARKTEEQAAEHLEEMINRDIVHGGTQTGGYAFGRGGNGSGQQRRGSEADSMEEKYHLVKQPAEAGGSGYIGGVPAVKHTNGQTYSPKTTAGTRTGNGYARITFIDFAEQETFSKITRYAYTGGMQTYTVPKTGVYKIEAWGAIGGSGFDSVSASFRRSRRIF